LHAVDHREPLDVRGKGKGKTGFGKHPCTKIREVEPAICRMPRCG
jgi:hypothetical protein